jgi:putative aldouronate transport system permease protein
MRGHRNRLAHAGFRRTAGDRIFDSLNSFFFLSFLLICLFPFYYLFINTISDNDLVARGAINFWPVGLTLSNYVALRNVADLGIAFLVTLGRTVLGTVAMVAVSAFAGYLVTKKEMWNRKFFYRMLVITMYFNAGLIPTYLNVKMLGLTDTFWVYIIPGLVLPFNIILVKTYIESIPPDLEESALIDGAGYFAIFMKIIVPLSLPILATIAIFGAVGHWNSFVDSLIYNQTATRLHTLQHVLYTYLNKTSNLAALMNSGADAGAAADAAQAALNNKVIKYTISMVSIIPILAVYPFMTRYFQKGIMLGAVKG